MISSDVSPIKLTNTMLRYTKKNNKLLENFNCLDEIHRLTLWKIEIDFQTGKSISNEYKFTS